MVPAPMHDGEKVEYKWYQQWYPVLPLSYMERNKPNKYKVLGVDIALWLDQDSKWRAAKDVCPHRQVLFCMPVFRKRSLITSVCIMSSSRLQ